MTSLRPIRSTRPPPSSPYFYRNWPCGSNRPAAVKSAAIMAANPALSTLRSRGCFRLPMLRSGRLALIPARVPPDPQWDTSRCFIRNSLGQSAGIIEGRNNMRSLYRSPAPLRHVQTRFARRAGQRRRLGCGPCCTATHHGRSRSRSLDDLR